MAGAPVRQFRNEMKDFLDRALEEPVRVNRRSDSFVVMNIEHYMELKTEIDNLKNELLGTYQVLKGETKDVKDFKF